MDLTPLCIIIIWEQTYTFATNKKTIALHTQYSNQTENNSTNIIHFSQKQLVSGLWFLKEEIKKKSMQKKTSPLLFFLVTSSTCGQKIETSMQVNMKTRIVFESLSFKSFKVKFVKNFKHTFDQAILKLFLISITQTFGRISINWQLISTIFLFLQISVFCNLAYLIIGKCYSFFPRKCKSIPDK